MSGRLRVDEFSGYWVIQCLVEIEERLLSELVPVISDLSERVERRDGAVVLDFANRPDWDPKFFRMIAPLGHRFKKRGKKIYVIRAPAAFGTEVRASGMDGMFCVLPSLETALADIQRSTGPREGPRADAAFLNEFIQAAIGTLRAQCGMDVRAGKARSGADRLDREIAGVIDLASEAFQGCIAIAYPKATFLNVIGRMLGETYPEITDDLEDGAAELLNMVFSRAKVGLNEKGFRIERAIPRTLRGKALESLHASEQPVLTIPFESDAGPFRIEIVVEAKRKAEAS